MYKYTILSSGAIKKVATPTNLHPLAYHSLYERFRAFNGIFDTQLEAEEQRLKRYKDSLETGLSSIVSIPKGETI